MCSSDLNTDSPSNYSYGLSALNNLSTLLHLLNSRNYLKSSLPVKIIEDWPKELIPELETNLHSLYFDGK